MWPQPEWAQQGPLPRLSAPTGAGGESCPSRPGRSLPGCPAAHSCRLAQDAPPGGTGSAPFPAPLSCSPLSRLPDTARPGPAGAGASGPKRAAELGCSSPAGSFRQATKSWPLGGSGVKLSREVEAGICSAPREMAAGGQRARGRGFVDENIHAGSARSTKSHGHLPLPKRCSQPLWGLRLGDLQGEKAPNRSGTRLN